MTNSDPYELYGVLHNQSPVYQIPEVGIYVITKYEDIRMALKDFETFSSDVSVATRGEFSNLHQSILIDGGGWEHVQTLQRTDPPKHRRYRKLVDRVFTKKRVDELLPHLDEVVNELIDNFIERGSCDFNDEFAMRMPGIIIAEQLGLSRDNVSTFKKWADSMLGASRAPVATEEEVTENAKIELEAQLFLSEVFESRRKDPKEDLMSALVHSHGDDEEPLSMHELQNLMHQLITGGYETTQSAINHGMWCLVRFPDIAEKLYSDEALLKPFIEEVLRWESPVQFLLRRTTKDAEVSGTIIPEGSMVMMGYGPANRDETKFECPHQFQLERKGVGSHLAFGSGAHHCPGALLGRQEMIRSFKFLVERMKNIKLAKPLPEPVHNFSMFFMPMKDFHIEFEKR
jgi:cytochrome P450